MSDGQRQWGLREAVSVLGESSWHRWPLEGRRTTLRVVRLNARHYGSHMALHTRFSADGKLDYGDSSRTQHQVSCQVLYQAITYDQLEAAQLSSIELPCRFLQPTKLKHRVRFLLAPGAGTNPFRATHLYLGTNQTRRLLMVCPAFMRHVGLELKDEFKAAEARRSAHEERQLREPRK